MDSNNQLTSQLELQQMPQNPQVMVQPMIPRNHLVQIIPTASTPTPCEKFSSCLTGSKNIPFATFTILLLSGLWLVISLFFTINILFIPYTWASFGNLLFAIFVWPPMASKIEKCSSTARYFGLFFINSSILNAITFCFPLCISKIWCFVLFETILISLSNKEKNVRFFGFKITGKRLISVAIIYSVIFNFGSIFSVIITIVYTFIYQKKLSTRFSIPNERVLKIENFCCCSFLKRNLKTFITLEECLARTQNSAVQNSNNSSFVPANIYPNYSGVANNLPNVNQAPAIVNNFQQPMTNVNMGGEPSYNYVPENSMSYQAQQSA